MVREYIINCSRLWTRADVSLVHIQCQVICVAQCLWVVPNVVVCSVSMANLRAHMGGTRGLFLNSL